MSEEPERVKMEKKKVLPTYVDFIEKLNTRGRYMPVLSSLPFEEAANLYDIEIKQVPYAKRYSGNIIETIEGLPFVCLNFTWHFFNTPVVSQGYFVPAVEARTYLWKHYRLNLAALSSYLRFNYYTYFEEKETDTLLKMTCGYELFGNNLRNSDVKNHIPGHVPQYDSKTMISPNAKKELYYALDDIITMKEVFDGKLLVVPPPCSISLSEPHVVEEKGFVSYYDKSSLEPLVTNISLSGFKGELESKLKKLFRQRQQIFMINKQILDLFANRLYLTAEPGEEIKEWLKFTAQLQWNKFYWYPPPLMDSEYDRRDYRHVCTDVEKFNTSMEQLQRKHQESSKEFRSLYIEFLKIAELKKEEIIAKVRALEKVSYHNVKIQNNLRERDAYTKMASTMRTINPHMSVLPAGITSLIQPPKRGMMAEANVRIQRVVYGQQNPVELQLYLGEEEKELPDLMRTVEAIFGYLGINWLPLLGYVGLCRIYEKENGYNINSDIETACSTFWKTIRPSAVDRINKKGLEEWWGKGHDQRSEKPSAADLYLFVMKFFASLNLPINTNKKGETLYGLTQISSVTQNRHGQPTVKWRFNPNLEKFITGTNPMYMVVNHEAMFSYERKELHVAPALQLYLEDQVRRNVYKGLYTTNKGTLLTPDNDGYLLGTLAERIGLPNNVTPSRNLERIISALDTVKKADVIRDFKVGRACQNPYETKVKVTMADTYQDIYYLARNKQKEEELNRELENPFAPVKK